MSRLFAAELRRVAARRMVRIIALLALVTVVVIGAWQFLASDSMSQQAFEQKQQAAHVAQQNQEANIQSCLRKHSLDPTANDVPKEEVARQCFANTNISAHDPRVHHKRVKGILQGVTGVLVIVAWVIGASLAGAEFASRGMTTMLTFEPRRGRVFAAKAAAVIAASAVLAVLTLMLAFLGLWPSMSAHGAPVLAGEPSTASLWGVIGRGIAMSAIGAGIGFAVASLGRSTAAALGVGFGYIVVLENIVGSTLAGWRRWLLLGNTIVFVSGENSGGDVFNRSVVGAAIFLTAVALTLLAAAATTFASRDIA